MKFWLKIIVIVLAGGILGISFVRASLEKVNQDEVQNKLRKIPISFQIENKTGGTEKICYELPETRTLPDSPFYGLKNLRDELWVKFSPNDLERARLMLLLADKKMEEAIILNQRLGKNNLVTKTSQEAVKKLKSANDLVSAMNGKDIEVQKIEQNIETAAVVYKKLINDFEIGNKNQENLFKIINTCNE